jgi:hypothetical protein
MNTTIKLVHIDSIVAGDTIMHDGKIQTVCHNSIKRGFCGKTLFGDSYRMGSVKVQLVTFNKAR